MSIDSPERMSCWSSTIATLIGCIGSILAGALNRLIRQVGVNPKSASRRGPRKEGAVIQGGAFPHADQPLPTVLGPVSGLDRLMCANAVVCNSHRNSCIAPV